MINFTYHHILKRAFWEAKIFPFQEVITAVETAAATVCESQFKYLCSVYVVLCGST